MNIEQTIQILENSITTMANAKINAEAMGDLVRVVELETKLEETRLTIQKLKG